MAGENGSVGASGHAGRGRGCGSEGEGEEGGAEVGGEGGWGYGPVV